MLFKKPNLATACSCRNRGDTLFRKKTPLFVHPSPLQTENRWSLFLRLVSSAALPWGLGFPGLEASIRARTPNEQQVPSQPAAAAAATAAVSRNA
jgi:hypothetical protein